MTQPAQTADRVSTTGQRSARRMTARVWTFVALTSLVAVGLDLLASASSPPPRQATVLAWVLLCLALAAIQRVAIKFNFRHESHMINFFVVPLAVGTALLSGRDLLVASALALVGYHVVYRAPLVRTVFNLANQMAGVAVAYLLMHATLGHHSPDSLWGWLALLAALVAFETVTTLGVTGVIALSAGWPGLPYYKETAFETSLLVPLGSTVAIVAVDAYWSQPWALLAMVGPLAGIAVILRSSNRLRTRFEDLQSLYDFTAKLADLSERSEVIAVALRETREIVHCTHIEMYVPRPSGAFRYRLDRQGTILREAIDRSEMESAVMDSRQARHLDCTGEDSEYLAERGFSDAMVVPMVDDDNPAVIVAADHEGNETVTFDPDDLKLLQTLAAHLSTALTSCVRLDRLRSEVAARQHETYHDSLTGLANRSLFAQIVTDALTHRRGPKLVAVILMDLDGFKEINDTLGHHAGDAILKEVANRIGHSNSAATRRMAARLGGDEFAFLVGNAEDMNEVNNLAQEILTAVGSPISVDGMILTMRASVGIATAPLHGSDASSLLKCADVAMYAAKGARKGIVVYDAKIDNNSTRRLALASELQRAVETDGFELHFQPIADLADGSIIGFEALLRWPHYEFGPVSPAEFIPVAEQTGLIEPITWWVLQRALEELKYWLDSGYELDMAVNISARSLMDLELVDRLRLLLAATGVAPQYVTLEITESSVMVDLHDSEQILRTLSDLGLRLAIDDFGTGYSSLSRLKTLPVEVVKVDQSFVKNMCHDPDDLAIVRSTVELAKVMGHQVIAEGVEDRETWEQLKEIGCTLAQGYYFSFPMSSENCRKWVRAKQTPTLAAVTQLKPHIA